MAEKSRGNVHDSDKGSLINGGESSSDRSAGESTGADLTTPVLIGVAVAVLQPELLPGMAIGVASMLVPKLLPSLAEALRPLVKGAVKVGYAAAARTWEMGAEAAEQVQDIMAEARAEEAQAETVRPASRARRRARAA